MTLTCPVCKRRFHKGKTPEFKRLSRHLWKEHSDYMKRKIKAGQRKKKKKEEVRPLDMEFMAIDDILLSHALGGQQTTQEYDPVHEQLGGLLLKAIVPILVKSIASRIQKGKAKK